MFPRKLKKKSNLVRFDVLLHAILGPPPPQTSSFACYMRPHSVPFLSFLAYYMGAPKISFFAYYGVLLCLFFCILCRGPHFTFFAYYIGAPNSLYLLTIGGPLQISFFSYNRGAPFRLGAPFAYYMGAPQISFFASLIVKPIEMYDGNLIVKPI